MICMEAGSYDRVTVPSMMTTTLANSLIHVRAAEIILMTIIPCIVIVVTEISDMQTQLTSL